MALTLILANLVTFAAAFVQAASGLGFAMVAIPLLVLLDPALVPGPSLFASIFLAITMAVTGRRLIVPREVRWLAPGLIVGTVLGATILAMVPAGGLELVFGVTILIAVAISLAGGAAPLTPPALTVGGFASGLMGTVSGIHGPPLAVLYHRSSPEKTRAMIAIVFACGFALSLIALAFAGRFGLRELALGAAIFPGVAAGWVAARLIAPRLPVALIRLAMLALAGASGALLVARYLA